ncbi:MAG: malonyl-CoA decarboxylase [Acetobacteraceae bacterium]|nr:malonyl-CoA decarboxylase [Acetobacteraceae bacterium]
MADTAIPGLFDRTIRRITEAWRDMAAGVAPAADDSIPAQMRACLASRGGEVSARNRAAKLGEAYLAADAPGRLAFLRELASFDADPQEIAKAAARLAEAADPAATATATAALRRALEPPRLRLLTQFTTIPDGVKFLVELRAELLALRGTDPALAGLEADLRTLLAAWFDIGFLDLRRIDWNAPASLLEKLVGYEAVHEIQGWRDLKNRLDADRRCYAFFHPRMPNEPLIFVEVALVQGLAGSVQALLDETAPMLDAREADTAIFYSISNCQRGLAGISFGNFLIKRVVEELSAEFRNLRSFATLSPIPGFRRWLDAAIAKAAPTLLREGEAAVLRAAAPEAPDGATALAALLGRHDWFRDRATAALLAPILSRLCAHYLLNEGRGKRAADPVAHFHLSNGARIERICPGADISDKGVKESAAMMVNYLYDPARIESYHEDYAGEGKRNAAQAISRLLKP